MIKKLTLLIVCISAIFLLIYLQNTSDNNIIADNLPSQKSEPLPIIREPIIEESSPTEQVTAQKPTVELEPLIAPPEQLDDSDSKVREIVSTVAPNLMTWLLPEQQIRKWVLTVDLLADGSLPKKYPPIDFPMAAFKIDKTNALLKIAESNHHRTEPLINILTAIDPTLIVRYYTLWLPILEQAYREQGKPGSFDARVHQAIQHILNVKQLPASTTLHQPHVFYQYTEEKYELSNDLSKLMWRMGAENMLKLQTYLKRLQAQLIKTTID